MSAIRSTRAPLPSSGHRVTGRAPAWAAAATRWSVNCPKPQLLRSWNPFQVNAASGEAPPSALPRPGIDADRHLVAVLAVRSPGEVASRVLARELVDPGQCLEQLERNDLAPDLVVTVRTG